MATFVQTTLTKRTGATTTVFDPSGISNGVAILRASGSTYTHVAPNITISSIDSGVIRRTRVRAQIPQVDASGYVVLARPSVELSLVIPEGTKQTDVNDLVGYINALSATGITNFNDILVGGVGVY